MKFGCDMANKADSVSKKDIRNILAVSKKLEI